MRKNIFVLMSIMAVLLGSMVQIKPSQAPATTTVYVSPVMSTGNRGDPFTIDIMIANVFNLYGYEFILYFNPGLVTATDLTVGDFFPTPPGYVQWHWEIGADYVWLAVTRPLGEKTGVSGSGRLASVVFSVVGIGADYLDLENVLLGNPTGPITGFIVYDGYFSNLSPTIMAADIRKRRSTNRPGEYIFKRSVHGTTQTLIGEIENLGNVPVFARVRFQIVDEEGIPPPGGSIYHSETVKLQPRESRVLTVDLATDSSMDYKRWYVSNYCEFDSDGDGSLNAEGQPDKVRSYSFRVVP